ncbi:hypothetical protein A2U01_0101059, partial [Trifolium medium]|nr:hypothetical protein [Trifolium medium]
MALQGCDKILPHCK